jgi:hypothetical protein
MSRAWINLGLDFILLVIFSALMIVSVIVRFIFPPGLYSQHWRLWGWTHHDWVTLQFGLVATLALGILIHVMLHWSWVCGMLVTRWKQDKKAKLDEGLQTIYGVGFMIVLFGIMGIILAAAKLTIVRPEL